MVVVMAFVVIVLVGKHALLYFRHLSKEKKSLKTQITTIFEAQRLKNYFATFDFLIKRNLVPKRHNCNLVTQS